MLIFFLNKILSETVRKMFPVFLFLFPSLRLARQRHVKNSLEFPRGREIHKKSKNALMLKSCIPIIFCFPRGYRGLHFSRFSPWISTDPLNSVHIHGSTPFSPLDIHGPSFLSLRGYPRYQKNFRPPYHDNNSPYPNIYQEG